MNKTILKILAAKNFYHFGVKTAAGRIIPIYWDPKKSLSHPKVLKLVAKEFAKIIKKIRPKIEVIAGGATGGISLAAAAALELNLPWVYIRNQAKGYGTDVLVEGDYKKGARAVLVDDVIATAQNKEVFLKNTKGQLRIKNILVILDDTGGIYPPWIKKNNIQLIKLFTTEERSSYYYQVGFFDKLEQELDEAYCQNRDGWQQDKKLYKKFLEWKK